MNISEEQAKEILDFLASKINSQAKCKIIPWFRRYIMQIKWFMSGCMHVYYIRENGNGDKVCAFPTGSYRNALKTLLNIARINDIECYCPQMNDDRVLIPHMTSLEQILLDMDMSNALS